MKFVYYLKSEVSDPLDKEFVSMTRKLKNKMTKDGFLSAEDAVLFVPTDGETHIFSISE